MDLSDSILNEGLEFAMEFGENWLKPIQGRLSQRHRELSQTELDEYERVCRKAMHFGHEQVPVQWHAAGRNERDARQRFAEMVKERYPWMSEACLGHLFSQGCYYAWKDGDL